MDKKALNILYTTNDLHFGGVSNVLLNSLPALSEHAEINLLYYGQNDTLRKRFEELGIQPVRIPYRGKIDFFSAIKKTKTLIEENDIDLVHTNLMLDKWIAIPAAWWARRPVIATLHSENDPYERFSPLSGPYWKNKTEDFVTSKFADQYIAVSQATKNNWVNNRALPPEKIQVIYSAISSNKIIEEYDNDEVKELAGSFDRLLITACRLHSIKGLDRLIRVFHRVLQSVPNAGLLILGEGRFRARAERMIEELGLEERVLMPGYREHITPYLNIADYYVNASYSEALGLSILEAMQIGLPTLGANVGGIPEIIEDGKNGFLLDFEDIETTTDCMIEALRMPDDEYQSLRKRTKKKFESRFTIERYLSQLLSFYRKILE